jgi:hypothetical protein
VHTTFRLEKLKGRYYSEFYSGSYGNKVGKCGVDSSGSGYGPLAGCCEYRNEPLDSIKGSEFLDCLSDY